MPQRLTWCEVSTGALTGNLAEFRRLLGPGCRLAPVVKANAYGHGLVTASRAFVTAGADVLCVNDLWEAGVLRDHGITIPIHVVGHVDAEQAADAVALDVSLVAYETALIDALSREAVQAKRTIRVQMKAETGTNRQGLRLDGLQALARHAAGRPGIELEGLSMHFADIEDTTDHTFARSQLSAFQAIATALRAEGFALPVLSVANSAATILWPETHLGMVRVGISAYGMWPSRETLLSAAMAHRDRLALRPALTWKTRIAQIKVVPPGEYVGYGRAFRATGAVRIAILPVGYYDGYDRKLSGLAHVLIAGRRAPVRGRICMNMTMVDVTDIPEAMAGSEVVLLGDSGDEHLNAEQLASWIGTINYEVTTRIAESVPRLQVA